MKALDIIHKIEHSGTSESEFQIVDFAGLKFESFDIYNSRGIVTLVINGAVAPTQNTTTANATQHGGDHYRNKPVQPWDFIAANGLDFFQGNIVKYVVRFREKHGVQDLEKARHYLDKLIELERAKCEKVPPPPPPPPGRSVYR